MPKPRPDTPDNGGGTATLPPPSEPSRPLRRVPEIGDTVFLFDSVGARSEGVTNFSEPAKVVKVHPGPELRVDLSIDREIPHYGYPQAPRGWADFRRMEHMWTWIDEDGAATDESPLMMVDRLEGRPDSNQLNEEGLPAIALEEMPEIGARVGVYARDHAGFLQLMPAKVVAYSDETSRQLDLTTTEAEITTRVAPGTVPGSYSWTPFEPAAPTN